MKKYAVFMICVVGVSSCYSRQPVLNPNHNGPKDKTLLQKNTSARHLEKYYPISVGMIYGNVEKIAGRKNISTSYEYINQNPAFMANIYFRGETYIASFLPVAGKPISESVLTSIVTLDEMLRNNRLNQLRQ